jgi:hypothetical protein
MNTIRHDLISQHLDHVLTVRKDDTSDDVKLYCHDCGHIIGSIAAEPPVYPVLMFTREDIEIWIDEHCGELAKDAVAAIAESDVAAIANKMSDQMDYWDYLPHAMEKVLGRDWMDANASFDDGDIDFADDDEESEDEDDV